MRRSTEVGSLPNGLVSLANLTKNIKLLNPPLKIINTIRSYWIVKVYSKHLNQTTQK